MQEDLVGYLFGALDQDASDRIERRLGTDLAMRRELDRIGSALKPLEADADVEPPSHLVERTVRRVLLQHQTERHELATTCSWRLADLAIAAGIFLAIPSIMLPAINDSRPSRAMVACRNNLRAIGVALENYSGKHGDHLPFYGTQGPLGIAGIYAPILIESQFVTDRSVFLCQATKDSVQDIHSVSELRAVQADIGLLDAMLRNVGGSYGSLLGFTDRGVYRSPRRDRLGGQTMLIDRSHRPEEGDVTQNSPNHGGRGQNALFHDGSVRFLRHPRECPACDNLFVSLENRVEPGLNERDQVFGPSDTRLCDHLDRF